MSESFCDDCEYGLKKPNEKPCSVCMQWVDGYLTAMKYESKIIKQIKFKEII